MEDKIIRLNFVPGICLCVILVGVYKLGRKTAFKDAADMVDIMGNGYAKLFEELIDNEKERES